LANDLRCTHGATLGYVEPEHLYYLMARGLPRVAAQRLIVEAFFEPVIARLLKAQFPIFSAPREKPLIYLDSAATSQKPQAVLDAMSQYYGTCNANIHRGVYAIAEQATALYEDARRRFASFVNASPREIVFTRNSTEALNLVA